MTALRRRLAWAPVPGFDGYEVSAMGEVRSWRPWRGLPLPRTLTPRRNPNGYLYVSLMRDGSVRTRAVHRLVAAAFIGPPPSGFQVRHIDGDSHNNALSNLNYGTPSENCLDLVVHGTHNNASRGCCKHGHPFSGENLVYRSTGARDCRTCRRDRSRRKRAKARAAA